MLKCLQMIPNLSLTFEAVQSGKPGGNQRHDYLQNNYGHNSWNLEGRALSALNRFGENARMVSEPVWLQRIQHQQALMELPGNQLLKIS